MNTAGVRTVRRNTGTAQYRHGQARTARMNRTMLKIVFAVLAASVFLYITGMARVLSGSRSINALHAQIDAEEIHRQQLEIALGARHNPEMIKGEAMSRLGRIYPAAASVRVITLPGDAGNGGAQTVYDAAGESAAP